MSDVRFPAFDRGGKYLYFTESTNYGTSTSGLDMSSDEFEVTRSVYGLALAADTASPVAPLEEDEKTPDAREKDAKEKKDSDDEDADKDKDKDKSDAAKKPDEEDKHEKKEKPEKPKPVKIDLATSGGSRRRASAAGGRYTDLTAGKEGTLYLLEGGGRFQGRARTDADPLRAEDEEIEEAGRSHRGI